MVIIIVYFVLFTCIVCRTGGRKRMYLEWNRLRLGTTSEESTKSGLLISASGARNAEIFRGGK